MVKKGAKKKRVSGKKSSSKKKTTRKPAMPKRELKLEKALIENFIALQKVMVNLSVKFDDLTQKISKLLELFEISAKALAEKDMKIEKTARDDEKIIKKIDDLSDQNKIIARGLTLMHERLSEEPESAPERMNFPMNKPMPPPMPPRKTPAPSQGKSTKPESSSMEGYQKSIASEQTFKKLPR